MSLGLNFYLELAVLLACLFYAAPRGGYTLGMIGGVGLIILGGGFIEIKTLLDNDLKAQEEKAKQAGKEKKRKGYNK